MQRGPLASCERLGRKEKGPVRAPFSVLATGARAEVSPQLTAWPPCSPRLTARIRG